MRQVLQGVGQRSLAEFWVSKARASEPDMHPALVRKVVYVVAQLYGYLVRTNCQYGIVTTYHMTWCVRVSMGTAGIRPLLVAWHLCCEAGSR